MGPWFEPGSGSQTPKSRSRDFSGRLFFASNSLLNQWLPVPAAGTSIFSVNQSRPFRPGTHKLLVFWSAPRPRKLPQKRSSGPGMARKKKKKRTLRIPLPETAMWSCSVLVDGFIKTDCLLFELNRADISKITMPSFSIVKYFDVFEHIGTCFFTRSITGPVYALSFQ